MVNYCYYFIYCFKIQLVIIELKENYLLFNLDYFIINY